MTEDILFSLFSNKIFVFLLLVLLLLLSTFFLVETKFKDKPGWIASTGNTIAVASYIFLAVTGIFAVAHLMGQSNNSNYY